MLLVRGDQLDDQREGRGRLFASGCLSLLPRTGAAQQLLRSWLAGDNGWRPAFASLHIVAPLLRSNCNSVTCIECAFHRNCATSVALLQILSFIKLGIFHLRRQAASVLDISLKMWLNWKALDSNLLVRVGQWQCLSVLAVIHFNWLHHHHHCCCCRCSLERPICSFLSPPTARHNVQMSLHGRRECLL